MYSSQISDFIEAKLMKVWQLENRQLAPYPKVTQYYY